MGSTELRAAAQQAQPEALRLADRLSGHGGLTFVEMHAAAAELRRLVAENDALRKTLAASCDEERQQMWEAGPGGGCSRALSAEFQRDALLEALKTVEWHGQGSCWVVDADKIAAAIKAAEENT